MMLKEEKIENFYQILENEPVVCINAPLEGDNVTDEMFEESCRRIRDAYSILNDSNTQVMYNTIIKKRVDEHEGRGVGVYDMYYGVVTRMLDIVLFSPCYDRRTLCDVIVSWQMLKNMDEYNVINSPILLFESVELDIPLSLTNISTSCCDASNAFISVMNLVSN
jgi:hypothetical protein